MRRYIDLGIDSRNIGLEGLEEMIAIALSMNFSALGVKLDPKLGRRGLELLRRLSEKHDVDLVSRVDLIPKSKTQLIRDLRRYRDIFEVVAVRTVSKRLSRVAAQEERVDLLSISSKASGAAFSFSAARLLASTGRALEIELSPLILSKGRDRVDLLSEMGRCVSLAQRFRVNLVISSGAMEKYLLRPPMDQASVARLLGMELTEALDSLSSVPQSIIERNRARLDPRLISPGVRLVEVPDDACST